jgi:hypothetical protein
MTYGDIKIEVSERLCDIKNVEQSRLFNKTHYLKSL